MPRLSRTCGRSNENWGNENASFCEYLEGDSRIWIQKCFTFHTPCERCHEILGALKLLFSSYILWETRVQKCRTFSYILKFLINQILPYFSYILWRFHAIFNTEMHYVSKSLVRSYMPFSTECLVFRIYCVRFHQNWGTQMPHVSYILEDFIRIGV